MDEETNPVKEFLFSYITDKKIQEKLIHGNNSNIIEKIISDCYQAILKLEGDNDEKISTLQIALLHYFLTNLLIPSQRKVSINGIKVDIVIPNVKSLTNEPKNSLIIYIPKKSDNVLIQKKLETLSKIQPFEDNIWLVNDDSSIWKKTFGIKNKTFPKIFQEINAFLISTKQRQFKIFKI